MVAWLEDNFLLSRMEDYDGLTENLLAQGACVEGKADHADSIFFKKLLDDSTLL